MRVAKWGNSLAIRLPASLVEQMNLRVGEEVDITFNSSSDVEIARSRRRQQALEAIRQMRVTMPADYKFEREEAYERGPG